MKPSPDFENPLIACAGEIKKFPVKFGAPSFVWPGSYSLNVSRLAEVFSEVQLLFFEPLEVSPIEPEEIQNLVELKRSGLSYSVHLPVPSGFGDNGGDPVLPMLGICETLAPINPSQYVLHIEKSGSTFDGALARRRLVDFIERSSLRPEEICVENLDESFPEVWDAVSDTGASICMDAGHIIRDGGDPLEFMEKYGDRISAAHIHGVSGRDHRPITAIDEDLILEILKKIEEIKISGAVIIENYSVDEMRQSLKRLAYILEKI